MKWRKLKNVVLPMFPILVASQGIADEQLQKAKVYLSFREVTMDSKAAKESGFDWLLAEQEKPAIRKPSDHVSMALNLREELFSLFEKKNAKLDRNISRPSVGDSVSDLSLRNRDYSETHNNLQYIAGVFTDPQFQVMLKAFEKKGATITTAPSVLVDSAQPGLVQSAKKKFAVIPVIQPDTYTVDLDIFLAGYGNGTFKPDAVTRPAAKVLIWDGQTVAVKASRLFGKSRIMFVTAQIMDENGGVFHRRN